MRDVGVAYHRIGGPSTEARCRWVLEEFVPRDPATLSSGDVANLRDNLQALAGYGGLAEAGSPFDAGEIEWNDPVLVDDAALHTLWERVGALAQAQRTPAPLPSGDDMLTQRVRSGPYVRLERVRAVKGLANVVILSTAKLLEACDRLRECPECHRLFVARRRQERHPPCARKARDARRPSRQKKGAQP